MSKKSERKLKRKLKKLKKVDYRRNPASFARKELSVLCNLYAYGRIGPVIANQKK